MSSKLQALLDRGQHAPTEAEREAAYAELTRLLTLLVRASMSRRLRGQRDSMDVCQSVTRSFIADFQASRIRFESEAALVAYLRRVVHHKLADVARRDGAAKRGGDVPTPALPLSAAAIPAADTPGPASGIILAEAANAALETFSEEDRALWSLRRRGWPWDRIARELGISEAAARQRWSRLQSSIAQAEDGLPAR